MCILELLSKKKSMLLFLIIGVLAVLIVIPIFSSRIILQKRYFEYLNLYPAGISVKVLSGGVEHEVNIIDRDRIDTILELLGTARIPSRGTSKASYSLRYEALLMPGWSGAKIVIRKNPNDSVLHIIFFDGKERRTLGLVAIDSNGVLDNLLQ